MNIKNLFFSTRDNNVDQICELFRFLNQNVEKYIDNKYPVLDGKKDAYYKLLDKAALPVKEQSPKTALTHFSRLFKRAVRWQHPGAFININPPANIVSIVASFYTSLYNPNFAQDESTGFLSAAELIVTKHLSELAQWDWKQSAGIFTFGGKGTNMYAVKTAIHTVSPQSITNGINGSEYFVVSNEKSHPCHAEVCDWLGLGKNNCLKIPVTQDGIVNLDEMEKAICNKIEKGQKLACIIVNGGTTNEIIVDPIEDVVKLREKIIKTYKLDYVPHIHVDAVIGWAWLFFRYYDFIKNPFNMTAAELTKIKSMAKKISAIKLADSFGADFHKTGFCPYISSIFMIKNGNSLYSLGNREKPDIQEMRHGSYSPFEYSLELTRSSIGPVSAYTALETFGIEGFQRLIFNIFSNGEYIRKLLGESKDFDVINPETEGIATLFVAKPLNFTHSYSDLIKLDEKIITEFVEYNHQFYLYSLQALENKEIEFKITFSKSYKPFGSKNKTGALKIYQMSPTASKNDIKKYIQQLILLKIKFDEKHSMIKEDAIKPVDFVYR